MIFLKAYNDFFGGAIVGWSWPLVGSLNYPQKKPKRYVSAWALCFVEARREDYSNSFKIRRAAW